MTKYDYRSLTSRPRKRDQGHSIVLYESWDTDPYGFTRRRRITCECGRTFAGNHDRAYYGYTAHLRDLAAWVADSTPCEGVNQP